MSPVINITYAFLPLCVTGKAEWVEEINKRCRDKRVPRCSASTDVLPAATSSPLHGYVISAVHCPQSGSTLQKAEERGMGWRRLIGRGGGGGGGWN